MKKEMAFLKAMGAIDEKFLEEADADVKPRPRQNYLKVGLGLAAAFVLGIGISSIPKEMYGGVKSESYIQNAPAALEAYEKNESKYFADKAEDNLNPGFADNVSESVANSAALANLKSDNSKLIYTSGVQLETTDFDDTITKLKDFVASAGGYFEDIQTDFGSYYYSSGIKNGTYTVRIPSGGYTDFVEKLSKEFHVKSMSQEVKDVALEYSDLEGRLATLKAKQERLQEFLKDAKDISEIIQIENSLADIEYEIDSYSGRLKYYDSKIDYSTVRISVYQVERVGEGIDIDNGFFSKLGRKFVSGINNFLDDIADFIYWVAYNIIGIAIAIVVVIFGIKIVKKIIKKRQAK